MKGISFVTTSDEADPIVRERNETQLTIMASLHLGRNEAEKDEEM